MPVALGTIASQHVAAPALPVTAGLVAWFDSTVDSAFTYSTGNDPGVPANTYVSQWNDLSGNANHAVGSGNAGYHPKRNVTINGLKAVDYSTGYVAVVKGLLVPTITHDETKPVSYFLVARMPASIPSSAQFNGGAGGGLGLRTVSSGGALEYIIPGVAALGATAAGAVAASTSYVIGGTYSPTGVYAIRVNGVVKSSGTSNQSVGTGGSTGLGSPSDTGGTLGGYMAEYAMYNRVLDAGEITDVESYLATKWGITLS